MVDDLDHIRLIEKHKYDRRKDYDRIKALERVLGTGKCAGCRVYFAVKPWAICQDARHHDAYELLKGGE